MKIEFKPTPLGSARNLKTASVVFARAFADHYFEESQDVFMARWRDSWRDLLELALKEREWRQAVILKQENRMKGDRRR